MSELRDVIDELESAGNTAQMIDDLAQEMQVPHMQGAQDRLGEKRGILNFGGKLLGSLFGLVTEEEAKDMEHAIQTLFKNQYKLANHFQTFERSWLLLQTQQTIT